MQRLYNLYCGQYVLFCVSCVLSVGNSGQFNMDRLSGLISRGDKALDRETQSSHVLEVEAFNSDQGSMRSSVRVGVCVDASAYAFYINRLILYI